MSIVTSFFRRRSIVKYARTLPEALSKDYGKSDEYSPAQVKATVTRNKLSHTHIVYAIALFCSPKSFACFCDKNEIDVEYDQAISDIEKSLTTQKTGCHTPDYAAHGPGKTGSDYGDSADGGGD